MALKNDQARITIDLPLNMQRKLKAIAALQGKSMKRIVIESIDKELKAIKGNINESKNILKDI